MLPYNLDHVGIAVHDLDAAITEYGRLYGAEPMFREAVPSQGVEEAMFAVGGSYIQLLGALGLDTPVGRYLEQKGEGVHHIAFAVPDIEAALQHLAGQGAELVDKEPRSGSRGTRIAFVHPRTFAGTLIELVELQA